MIASIPEHIELLAPVGRWKGLDMVLDSGADAVYLGGKEYNMRMHRSDFNFDRDEMARAAEKIHAGGAFIYVVINSLLSDREMDAIGEYVSFLESIGVDAVIVQDLGLIHLVKEQCCNLPIHTSTMMNIHSPEGARACASLGIKRIICSRDITLGQLKEIQQKSGLEMEFFVHGDMCIAQSGQCYTSGILFGKSSNRGKCMKPCRWPYDLIDLKTGASMETKMEGKHLLASKDMCMFQFIPDLVAAGVSSFKIEGRMRPPEAIAVIVRAYRQALDSYLNDPIGYVTDPDLFDTLYRNRVREFSTCFAFKKPNGNLIGSSGNMEPLFLSTAGKELEIDLLKPAKELLSGECHTSLKHEGNRPLLAVHAGDAETAETALRRGADWVYIGGEIFPHMHQRWGLPDLKQTIQLAHELGKKVGILTPRVTLTAQLQEIAWFVQQCTDVVPDAILVHNLGTLGLVRRMTDIPIYADFSFNIINRKSVELMEQLGVRQVTLSLEASCETLADIAANPALPIECIVHGSMTGMYLEHCIMSMVLMKTSSHDPCRGLCRYMQLGLSNKMKDIYPIEADQYCRSHIHLSKDLACINYLDYFLRTGVASIRIEAHRYKKNLVATVTELYAGAVKHGHIDPTLLKQLVAMSPRGFSLGAYPTGIFKTAKDLQKNDDAGLYMMGGSG